MERKNRIYMAFKADSASSIGKQNTKKENQKVTTNNTGKRNVTGVLNTKTDSSVRSFRVDEYN